jgi:hypothetical protein
MVLWIAAQFCWLLLALIAILPYIGKFLSSVSHVLYVHVSLVRKLQVIVDLTVYTSLWRMHILSNGLAQIWVYCYVLIYAHGQDLMSSGYNFTRLWLHSLSSTISTILTSEVCFLMLSTFGVRLLGPKGMCGVSRSPYVWRNTACVYPSNHYDIIE